METMRVEMGRAAKRVRCSYPSEPERAEKVAAGVMCAMNAKYRVTHHRYMPTGQGAITLIAPSEKRPSPEVARVLKALGFLRATNHTWHYPVTTPPDWSAP